MYDAITLFRRNDDPVAMILSFQDEWDFLSNFYPAVVGYRKVEYPATENAYFAWRTASDDFRQQLETLKPSVAKAAWNDGWKDSERDGITKMARVLAMGALVHQKYVRHGWMVDRLLESGDAVIMEGNTWKDDLFGVRMDAGPFGGQGHNALGRIHMVERGYWRAIRKGA